MNKDRNMRESISPAFVFNDTCPQIIVLGHFQYLKGESDSEMLQGCPTRGPRLHGARDSCACDPTLKREFT